MTVSEATAGQGEGEALALMAQVHERAVGPAGPAGHALAPGTGGVVALPYLQAARVHLSEQDVLGGRTRFALIKRLLLRISRLFTHRLVAAERATADGVEQLDLAVARLRAEIAAHGAQLAAGQRMAQTLQAQMTSVELGLEDSLDRLAGEIRHGAGGDGERLGGLVDTVAGFEGSVRRLESRLTSVEQAAAHERSEWHRSRALLARVARDAVSMSQLSGGTAVDRPAVETTLDDRTYVDFELAFRGSRDEIAARQEEVFAFVADLAGREHPLVDLGSGRGEWLELLRTHGVNAYGVDSNKEMVAEAEAHGLRSVCADVLGHLESLPPSSIEAVTGFHLAEHLPFAALTRLIDAAILALRPGGRLLLETPNPTNLVVGAASFYLDPSHVRPLHPDLLRFLLESRGFVDVEVHFLHPVVAQSTLEEAGTAELWQDARLQRVVKAAEWALFGPQDYLVVARRVPAVA